MRMKIRNSNTGMQRHEQKVDISIVLPVYNEEDGLMELHERLAAVLRQIDMEGEILFVNENFKNVK